MNYHDSRDWFSDYLDEALSPAERAGADAHLADCGECRRELERFLQTVSLLHRVERPRAPAGFVDRVVAAATPAPWYRRWLGHVFPLPMTMPVQVAALVILSVGAVYLFQRTPELQQAARETAPPATGRLETPAAPPATSSVDSFRGKSPEPSRRADQESDRPKPERKMAKARPPLPASKPISPPAESAAPPSVQAESKSIEAEAKKEGALDRAAAQPSGDMKPRSAPAPSAPAPPERQGSSNERLQSPPSVVPTPGLASKSAAVTTIVAGRLAVKDRDTAERALAQLLNRLKVTELSRRRDSAGVVLEVLVSKEAYGELTEGLSRIGAWTLEAEPSELPAQVPMRLRLLE
ncbi:MAG TPA: zf-HC2 domain-containing protein [Methylomirabilota bacterium]|nr:zf-HC2 domain-containing protein [Methylomirabilota bacterium]